jgi:hypothetical protein
LTRRRGCATLYVVDSSSVAVIAAITSVIVGIITYLGTVQGARRQVSAQLSEIVQDQFKGILAKRIEVYPSLWQLVQTSVPDRKRIDSPVDRQWAEQLFGRLIEWHAQNGVFLTQASYGRFSELRDDVAKICQKSEAPTEEDRARLDLIWSGVQGGSETPERTGLATELKNDLGGYRVVAVSIGR